MSIRDENGSAEINPIDRKIGLNVRAEIYRAGRTQEQMAAALHLGQASMSYRIRGVTPFRVTELVAISRELGIPLARLLVDID